MFVKALQSAVHFTAAMLWWVHTMCLCDMLFEGEGTWGIEEGDELLSELKPAFGCVGYVIYLAARAQGCACGVITHDPHIKQA